MAEEAKCRLGAAVGYSIRFDECFSREYTKIKFITEGILIREMLGDPLLSQYSVLVLDEVHERTAQIDIIMGLLKKILKRRRDLKIIISSATVDAEYLRDFFNSGKEPNKDIKEEKENGSTKSAEKEDRRKEEKALPATILSVEGRNYSVDVYYLTDPCPDYVRACVDTCVRLHEQVIFAVLPSQHLFFFILLDPNYTNPLPPFRHCISPSWCSVVYIGLMHISCRESFMK